MKFTVNLPIYDMFRATPEAMLEEDIIASLSLMKSDYVSLRLRGNPSAITSTVTAAISNLPVDHENKKFYIFLSTKTCSTKRKTLLELLNVLLPSIGSITSFLPFEEIILVPLNYTVQKEYELSEIPATTLDKLVTLDVQFKHFKAATIETMFNVTELKGAIAKSSCFVAEKKDFTVKPRFEIYGSSSNGQTVSLAYSSFITAAKEILGVNLVEVVVDEFTPKLVEVLDTVNSESLIVIRFGSAHYSKIRELLDLLIRDVSNRYTATRTFRIVLFGQRISTALTDLHLTYNNMDEFKLVTRYDFDVEDLIKLANTVATNAIETTYFNPVKIEEKPNMNIPHAKINVNIYGTISAHTGSEMVLADLGRATNMLQWVKCTLPHHHGVNCWSGGRLVNGGIWVVLGIPKYSQTDTTSIIRTAVENFTSNAISATPATLNLVVLSDDQFPTYHHLNAPQNQWHSDPYHITVMPISNIMNLTANQFRPLNNTAEAIYEQAMYPNQPMNNQFKQQPLPGTSFNRVNGQEFTSNYNIHPEQPEWDINLFQPSVQLIADKINNGSYSIFGHEIYIDSMTGYADLSSITSPTYMEKRFVFGSPVKRKVISPTTLVLPTTCEKAVSTPVPVIIKIQDKHYTYLSVKENEDVGNRAWILLIELDVERDLETTPYCNLDSVNMF